MKKKKKKKKKLKVLSPFPGDWSQDQEAEVPLHRSEFLGNCCKVVRPVHRPKWDFYTWTVNSWLLLFILEGFPYSSFSLSLFLHDALYLRQLNKTLRLYSEYVYMQSNQRRREKRKCSKSTHFNTNLFFQQQQQKENTREMGMELFSISHFPKPVISFKEKKEVDIQIFIEIFFSEKRKKKEKKRGIKMEEARNIHLTGRKDFVFIFSSLIIFCSQF